MDNVLEVRNLSKKYRGFTLDKVSFALPAGCILGLVGENGAGKSTTIRLLLRMIRKDGGGVRILGASDGDDLTPVKQDMGVVLDEVGYPEALTARQMERIFSGIYTRWSEEDFASYMDRFSLPWDKPFKEYSKGMKMKLGIATALSHGARLLILDEATSGLDPVVRDEVVEILSEFTRNERNAVLISSHIVSDLEKLCDYIAFLHKGKLLLLEEKDRLSESYGVVRCSESQLAALPAGAVLGKKVSPYGAEAVVRRDKVPAGLQVGPVSIEELFVYMAKGGK